MALATATASTCSCSSQLLLRPKFSSLPFPIPFANRSRYRRLSISFAAAAAKKDSNAIQSQNSDEKKEKKKKQVEEEEEEVEEVEEELPWLQEKALDVVEFTGSVTQAIPGPRVGTSSLPWILALPLAYAGLTFVIAFVKTVKKLSSPREKRRKLVNKNAFLCKSIDQLHSLTPDALKALEKKTGFGMEEILRKYIRYALNEKPFNPDLVAHLIHLRKASMLDDSQVASILNDVSARIVRNKGTYIFIFIFIF